MPAVSQAQRAYLNARFGHAWVVEHHFDNKGKLPEHVRPPRQHARGAQIQKMLAAGNNLRGHA